MITDIGGRYGGYRDYFPGRHRYQHLSEDGRDKMNEAIINYIRKMYGLLIGEKMAEK